jgi:hypothetical protein
MNHSHYTGLGFPQFVQPAGGLTAGGGAPPPPAVSGPNADIAAAKGWLSRAQVEIQQTGTSYAWMVDQRANWLASQAWNGIQAGGGLAPGDQLGQTQSGAIYTFFGWQDKSAWGILRGLIADITAPGGAITVLDTLGRWVVDNQAPAGNLVGGAPSFPPIGSGLQSYTVAFRAIQPMLDELVTLRQAARDAAAQIAGLVAQVAGLQAGASSGTQSSADLQGQVASLQTQLKTANAAIAAAASVCVR